MSLRLYNTRTRAVEPLVPLVDGEVRIYVCGLTPSAEAHLGHARSFLFFDVLRRYLAHPRNGYRVTYVQNVTDIDDRSIAAATSESESVESIVAKYYGRFKAAMRVLGVREPDLEPHATQHIDPIVDMIAELIATGHAYATDDGVYYAVKSFPRYGELSHRNVDELLVGARIAENEHKRDPLDFALWKFAKPGEPEWPSPWGLGRPGWHIECSAMSRELLGVPFDIHGGGSDLIFPHHENEIAQSEPLMPPHEHMANDWVHGAMLNFDGKKMSKSLGNFEPLTAMLERHDPLAIRLLFLQTGYRKPMNFTEDAIGAANSAVQKLRKAYDAAKSRPAVDSAAVRERFFEALDDDMNTAGALGVLFDSHRRRSTPARARRCARRAGRRRHPHPRNRRCGVDRQSIERLRTLGDAVIDGERGGDRRARARKARDFALADQLRKALSAEGIVLTDGKDGSTTWTVGGA